MARKKRNPDAEKLAESILNTYQHESVEDMQDALVFDELKVRGVEDVFSFRWMVFPVSKKAQKLFFLTSLCSVVLFILFEMRCDTLDYKEVCET